MRERLEMEQSSQNIEERQWIQFGPNSTFQIFLTVIDGKMCIL